MGATDPAARSPSALFWSGRRVLVTGHTGFKGGWLTLWLEALGAKVVGLSLAPEAGAPSFFDAARVADACDSRFGDVRDSEAVSGAVAAAQPEIVFHLAAQSLVRRSLADPLATWSTNVMGSAKLLQALRDAPELWATLVATSDKVYANDGSGRPMVEGDPLGGADPYSASKAACELLVASHRKSFPTGAALATARAGNVIGGGDFSADRLVPDAVRAAEAGAPLTLRHPEATRPWQHVLDCLEAYLLHAEALATDPAAPDALNVGPSDQDAVVTVGTVAERITRALAEDDAAPTPIATEPDAGSVEATALALDASRASAALGWRPRLDGPAALDATAAWYRAWRAGEDMAEASRRALAERMS